MTTRCLLLALVALVGASPSAQTPLGTFASGLDRPHDVIQLADGRVLVSSENDREIRAYAPDGTDLGPFVTFDGPFGPEGLAQLADGRVLATVRFDVRAFTPDGTELAPFATDLNLPMAITQLADGRVLVAEYGQSDQGRVTAFAPDGGSRRRFARQLRNPFDLVQLEDDRVLVVERGEPEIEAFAVDGTPLGIFVRLNTLAAITQLKDGRLLVSNVNDVLAFDSNGTPLGTFVTDLDVPYALTQLADGRVVVTEWSVGEVEAFGVIPVASEHEPEADAAVSAAYPSPVEVGTSARLAVTMSEPGEVIVAVLDAVGREISREVHALGSGRQPVEVETAGLAAGVYAVRVAGPGVDATRRLVVVR